MIEGEKELRDWIATEKSQTLKAFYKLVTGSALSASPKIDKLSAWFLAAAGGVFALVISKLDTITKFIELNELNAAFIYTLFPSAIFGLIQKFYALLVGVHVEGANGMDERVKSMIDEYTKKEDLMDQRMEQVGVKIDTDPNLAEVLTRYSTTFPWWLRFFGRRTLKKHAEDELLSYDVATKRLFKQSLFSSLQILFFLGFLGVIVFALST